jgi:DNA-binding response OmpR family regulator
VISVAERSAIEVKSKIKTRRILFVDDELDIAFTLKTTLEEKGLFQVDTFHDAEYALSEFRPDYYDLALLDIRMPKMNGFQLCRKIRQLDKKLKICFLTATELLYYRETDSDIIDDLGTDCFVTKPVNNNDIIDRLQSILSMKIT